MIENIKTFYANHLSKVKFYDRTLRKNYLSVIAVVSSIVTFLSFFTTAQNIENTVTALIVAGIFMIILVGIFLYMWWKANHKTSAKLRINNTNVCVEEGNIFVNLDKPIDERTGEISIIAANNFYDIIVDNRIVAEKTLHGQYIKRLIEDNKVELLDKAIEGDEVLNKPGNYEDVEDRGKGRKRSYSIGSVIEFEAYVLAAFTKFDADNKAYLSADEYTNFWMRFWGNIDGIYAGRTINIPLIGAGITRFRDGKPTKQELLEVMLWTLKISGFHNTYADKQINFIIYKSDVEEIDFYHIQHNQNFR